MSLWVATGVIILPSLFGELLNSKVLLRGDPVLDYRRLIGMEILSWSPILVILPMIALTGVVTRNQTLWGYGVIIVIALSLPLRILSVFAISPLGPLRKIAGAATVPLFTILCYWASGGFIPSFSQQFPGAALVIGLGILVSTLGVSRIVRQVDSKGTTMIGDLPMDLFRAFLQHWLKKDPKPLEGRLRTLGSKATIETAILSMESEDPTSKACLIVSNFHPGPYRDLGSGGLPSTLKMVVDSSLHTVSHVPHGISSHEYNIISREDIDVLLQATKDKFPRADSISTASRLVRAEVDGAKASAQAFGDVVLLTLTLAPQDMEDLPPEVADAIRSHASRKGVRAITIDAHNSLSAQTAITPDQARSLTEAAVKAMDLVVVLPQSSFKVGTADDPLKDFTLEEGIGPGGVSLITIETENQLAAYLTIDGNNMETGFRSLILATLREAGVDEGEVLTTDTHLVTGLVSSPLGYHPVGESIDKGRLVAHIQEALERAKTRMGISAAGYSKFDVEVTVLGSSTFQSITSFTASVARRIAQSFIRLELAVLVITVLALVLV